MATKMPLGSFDDFFGREEQMEEEDECDEDEDEDEDEDGIEEDEDDEQEPPESIWMGGG